MSGATLPIYVAIAIQLTLGLIVFQANWHRKANQCFLLLSLITAGWLGSLSLVVATRHAAIAAISIRQASVFGLLILLSLNLLHLALTEKQPSWGEILRRNRFWLLTTAGAIVFCQTKYFLQGVRFSHTTGAFVPSYSPYYGIYFGYFGVIGVAVLINYSLDIRRATGAKRTELTFMLIGAALAVGSALLSIVLGLFIDKSRLLWLAPARIVLFSLIISYGIATRKIMDVGVLLRRTISYTLLAAYLLALYALVWWLVATALQHSTANAHSIAHIVAAIAVAFAMAPARGVSQRLAERLFIGSHQLDFRATVSKAAKVLTSVTTLQDLLDKFANTVAEAVGTDRLFILLGTKHGFSQQYPQILPGSRQCLELTHDQATIQQLESTREPIVMDELHRLRPTSQIQRVIRQLDSLQIALAMGIFSRDHLAGVLLLGTRKSGRIYGSVEQNALQVLCGQLAVAIENAELFTEVQNAKIYNETLLENLTSAVIAAGIDERITVFNNEAGQITGFRSEEMLDRPIEDLPETLREPLRKTLQTGKSQESGEIVLHAGANNCIVRASTSIFHGQDTQVLGAMMVLTDITALKQLELQIRRSDRLASLGTLSAGMAHEIKNPLVSIKTFAQLLPERYLDSDFRETFSNLIGHEIDRIDSLVNQLLRFARPAKPLLKPLHVHEALEKALLLIGHRLYQKEIKLTRSWEANVDTIRADADQLEQVFLNFFLNAMDAMKNGGELMVNTQILSDERWSSGVSQNNGDGQSEFLRITIRDTGEGIRTEDIPHVFDPFFTTKDYGTGLGLSVVHGIIQEHGGQIEVESELQKGTAFHILLPLATTEAKVAAA
jgi:PAS domain S-box-containing protein